MREIEPKSKETKRKVSGITNRMPTAEKEEEEWSVDRDRARER